MYRNKITMYLLLIVVGCFLDKKHIKAEKSEKVITLASEKLFGAIIRGDIGVAKIAIKEIEDVNAKDVDGRTALLLAAEEGQIEIVKELIKAGADISVKGKYGKTTLMIASAKGYIEVVRELMKAGADINAKGQLEGTALMEASEGGHIEVIRELMKAGADINAKDRKYGKTALMIASAKGYIDIVRELMKAGADINAKGQLEGTALIMASSEGHIAVVKELIKAGADVNAKGKYRKTTLMYASGGGYIEAVRELIKAGAKIEGALIEASGCGHIEAVQELMEARADVDEKNEEGNTALILASLEGHIDIVKKLLRAGANVNVCGEATALIMASSEGHIAVVKELIKAKADINAESEEGRTAFSIACGRGKIEIAYYLIEEGAEASQYSLDLLVKLTDEEAKIISYRSVSIEILRKYCAYLSERALVKQQIEIEDIVQKYLIKERLGELVYYIVSNMSMEEGKINIDISLSRILNDYISCLNIKNAVMLMGQKCKNSVETPINIIDYSTLRDILNMTKSNEKEIIERLMKLRERWIKSKRHIIMLTGMKAELIINELFD